MYNLGFTKIDSFTSNKVFVFFRKKGDATYPLQQKIGQTGTDVLQVDAVINGTGITGTMTSTVVGPAKTWQSLKWQMHASDAFPLNDSGMVSVYGVRINKTDTLLYSGNTRDVSLGFISATQFPNLRMVWTSKDSLITTAPQLDYWRVLFTPMPEAALNPNRHFAITNTLPAGTQEFSVAIENLSDLPMDSMLVAYKIINAVGNTVPLSSKRFRPLAPLDTLHAAIAFDPNSYIGENYLSIEANPANDQVEAYHPNNIGALPFTVTSPLPLKLLSFTGELRNDNAVLSWQTTNEQDVDHFELERSYDANIFQTINKTKAFNTYGTHDYSYTDEDWAKTSSPFVYYRLKMVDMNGKYSRSNTVKFAHEKKDVLIVNVYPNPASAQLNLQVQTSAPGTYTVKITDVTGKEYLRNAYKLSTGNNVVNMPVQQLPAGIYLLILQSENGNPQETKFIKQ